MHRMGTRTGTRTGTGTRVTRTKIGNKIFYDVAVTPALNLVAAASFGARRLSELLGMASSNDRFSVDENLSSAPVLTVNPTNIPRIAPSEEQFFEDNEVEEQSFGDNEVQDRFSVDDYLPSAPVLTVNPMNIPRVPEALSKDQLLFLRNEARENPDCLEEKMSILFFSKEENSWVAESLVRVKKQALKQGVVNPIRAIIPKRMGVHDVASATVPSEDSRSTYHLPSDSGVSEAGSSHNEPISTPVSSSKSLMLEENLSTAPALTINPSLISAIPEEPLLEKLKDEDLQNAGCF